MVILSTRELHTQRERHGEPIRLIDALTRHHRGMAKLSGVEICPYD